MPDGTKPLPQPMLTYHEWGPVVKILIINIGLKSHSTLQSHAHGDNGLKQMKTNHIFLGVMKNNIWVNIMIQKW